MEKEYIYVSKFHRKVPIKEFDTRQTVHICSFSWLKMQR